MSDLARIHAELNDTNSAVGAAQLVVDQGEVVDLSTLEHRVEAMCDAIVTLPASDRGALKPPLLLLIDGLNRLAETLSTQQKKVAEQLGNVTTGKRVVSAYRGGAGKAGQPTKK